MAAKRKPSQSAAPPVGNGSPPNSAQTIVTQQWSGALPPPAALEHFDRIIPNGAERIMAMSEREQAHRHARESEALKAEIKSVERAQRTEMLSRAGGFLALLACVAGAVFLGMNDHDLVAAALVSVPVMAAIGWLLRTRPWRNGS